MAEGNSEEIMFNNISLLYCQEPTSLPSMSNHFECIQSPFITVHPAAHVADLNQKNYDFAAINSSSGTVDINEEFFKVTMAVDKSFLYIATQKRYFSIN